MMKKKEKFVSLILSMQYFFRVYIIFSIHSINHNILCMQITSMVIKIIRMKKNNSTKTTRASKR